MYISQNYYSVFPQLQSIITLYEEIEQNTSLVKLALSMDCPKGCGECCTTSSFNIEASLLEMLPLCVHLYETNSYQTWMNNTKPGVCPFFSKHPNEQGCCSVYTFRPLICRLFGFSFMKNKYGAIAPVACPTLQKQFNAQKDTNAVTPNVLPFMSAFSLQAMMIDPAIGTIRYPIDEAFLKAMNYVIYKMELHQQSIMAKKKLGFKVSITIYA